MREDGPPPEAEMQRMRQMARRTNFGFERVERLPGNVGYLDLRQFAGVSDAQRAGRSPADPAISPAPGSHP